MSWIGWWLDYRSQTNLFRDSVQIAWLDSFQWIQMATYAPEHISIKIDQTGFMLQVLQRSGNWTHGMGMMSGSRFEYLYLLRNLQITSQFLYHPNLPYSCPSALVLFSTVPCCLLLEQSMWHTVPPLMQVTAPRLSVFVIDLSRSWCWSDWKLEMPGPERDYFFSFLFLKWYLTIWMIRFYMETSILTCLRPHG